MICLTTEKGVLVSGLRHFNIEQTLLSGQCFRFAKQGNEVYALFAKDRAVEIQKRPDGALHFSCDGETFRSFWAPYFDLGRDYGPIIETLRGADAVMAEAAAAASGVRVLRQDGWETLVTFILSQNNNIPRIKGIVSALCEAYGEDIPAGKAFPTADALAKAGEAALYRLKTGFRAKYIWDAARKAASGALDLEALEKADDETLIETLQTVRGVGPKVAECTALFGFGRQACFPVDVWIARVMRQAYFNGREASLKEIRAFAAGHFGAHAGIAQQFLFHYVRQKQGALPCLEPSSTPL